MNAIFENNVNLNLMTWEVNPRLRNKNNVVTLVTVKDLIIGDIIIGNYNEEFISSYKILNIIDKRDSSLKGFKFYRVNTEWTNSKEKIKFSQYKLNVSEKFKKLFNLR